MPLKGIPGVNDSGRRSSHVCGYKARILYLMSEHIIHWHGLIPAKRVFHAVTGIANKHCCINSLGVVWCSRFKGTQGCPLAGRKWRSCASTDRPVPHQRERGFQLCQTCSFTRFSIATHLQPGVRQALRKSPIRTIRILTLACGRPRQFFRLPRHRDFGMALGRGPHRDTSERSTCCRPGCSTRPSRFRLS